MEGLRDGEILLDKYRIERVIGEGGMGVVLKVTHLHLGEELAIKVLSPAISTSPDARARFLREAQAVVRLRGEHVARAFDVGVLPGGALYMVMEYLEGRDLAAELARRGALFPGEAVDHVLQACEALAEAHGNGIVHRDIKPNNLFLTTRPDGTPLVKVLDFGISKSPARGEAPVTRTDIVMGTQGYMSPEQMKASKDVDARTDIWALGIVLYECLAGRRPFEAESFSAFVLRAATEPAPPLDARIPRGLQAVVRKCLEKDRNARFPTIAALAAALAPFAGDPRAAATIVDRTRLMTRGTASRPREPEATGSAQMATTLSGSAGSSMALARRRRIGIVALFGSIAGISIGIVLASGRATDAQSDASPEPPSDVPVVTSSAPRVDAGEAPVAVDVAPTAKVTEPPGDQNKAAERSDRAVRETQDARTRDELARANRESHNERKREAVLRAIRDGDLRAARAAMSEIGEDSVHRKTAREAFTRAETQAVEQARRTAQNLVSAHDCTGLRRYHAQLKNSSTDPVAAIAGSLVTRCVAVTAPAQPRPSEPAPTATPNPVTDQQVTGAAAKPACDHDEVEALILAAGHQYSADYAKVALVQMVKALACKQDIRMYRLAATYACAAHDLSAARQYFKSVPKAFQSGIVQKCQQEGLDVRGESRNDDSPFMPLDPPKR